MTWLECVYHSLYSEDRSNKRERERERERQNEDMLTWLDKYDARYRATMTKPENARIHCDVQGSVENKNSDIIHTRHVRIVSNYLLISANKILLRR
jgi:hypothetical protein